MRTLENVKRLALASAPVTLFSLLVGFLLGAITVVAFVTIAMSKPPVTIMAANELDGAAQRGSFLDMHYKFLRTSECNSISATWLWRWVDTPLDGRVKSYVSLGTSPVTLADPSPLVQEIIIAMPLPPAVTPGRWFLRQKFLDSCRLFSPVFGPTARVLDDIPVQIEARK